MKGSICFISIMGAVEDLGRFCDAYLRHYDIHLEKVLKIAKTERRLLPAGSFFPFTGEFTDLREADFFGELKKDYERLINTYGPPKKERDKTAGTAMSPLCREQAMHIYQSLSPVFRALLSEKDRLKSELSPKEQRLSEGGSRLALDLDGEERLELSRELNELYAEISRLRQQIYETDIKLAGLMRDNAADLRGAADYFINEKKLYGIRDYAAIYRDERGCEYFLICGFMRSDRAAELSRAIKEDDTAAAALKKRKGLGSLKAPLSARALKLWRFCPESLRQSRLLKRYKGIPFRSYWRESEN